MEKVTIKIPFNNPTNDFSKREKILNVSIQKQIENFNSQGLIVVEHKVLNKTSAYASVQFGLKRMVRG